ncbi:Elongator subunit elp4 [Malassezia psittaci]|uniref:Elongator complex protein 4 n=1 Tax=Malassezia psittaci TaxID=1821823 RepID=A0AAF0JLI8_9BASI|nr:Elongator subunit elp4 [Malassezia psittaci]
MGSMSVAQLSAPSVDEKERAAYLPQPTAAAEPYTDLFLAYTAAQGIASEHVTVVLGPNAIGFTDCLMGRATDEAAAVEEKKQEPSSERMKIAWRYEHMQKSNSTPQKQKEADFCSLFDLTKRISNEDLERARSNNLLYTTTDDSVLSQSAWDILDQAVGQCRKQAAEGSRSPALRIVLRDWGSLSWNLGAHQMFAWLMRLRRLARSLSMPSTGPAIPCIVAISLSSQALIQEAAGANLFHRLAHVADGVLGLSSFAASPTLRDVFPDSTGALRIFRTPAIGTLTNPSLRASVLRGMGTGSSSQASRGPGGAGGGENNLAFKVRRKRLVIDTLHLDTDGGVNERRTKPKDDTKDAVMQPQSKHQPNTQKNHAAASQPLGQSIEQRDSGARADMEVTIDSSSSAPQQSKPGPATRVPFTGLKSLRQRGLQAQAGLSSNSNAQLDF